MSADPFNSVGGYTVGIPPIPVISSSGDVTVNAILANTISVLENAIFSGNITANMFVGNFQGNIVGNSTAPGNSTQLVFNSNGSLSASPNFTFDSTKNLVTITGNLVANSLTMGTGSLEFSTSTVYRVATNSNVADQIIHSTVANTICSIDYTIIATDIDGRKRQTSKLFATVLDSDVGYFEYGTIEVPYIGNGSDGVGDFKVVYDSGNINLTVSPFISTTADYKIMVTSYKE